MLDALFGMLLDLLNFFIDLLPTFDMGFLEVQALRSLFEMVYLSSFFVPWSTVFICMSIAVFFYSTLNSAYFVNWLIDKIPFI